MMKHTYPAVLNKNQYQNKILYNVTFPDIPSANTYGENIKDARMNAEFLLETLLKHQSEIPQSSTMVEIQNDYPDSIISLITITLDE